MKLMPALPETIFDIAYLIYPFSMVTSLKVKSLIVASSSIGKKEVIYASEDTILILEITCSLPLKVPQNSAS